MKRRMILAAAAILCGATAFGTGYYKPADENDLRWDRLDSWYQDNAFTTAATHSRCCPVIPRPHDAPRFGRGRSPNIRCGALRQTCSSASTSGDTGRKARASLAGGC